MKLQMTNLINVMAKLIKAFNLAHPIFNVIEK